MAITEGDNEEPSPSGNIAPTDRTSNAPAVGLEAEKHVARGSQASSGSGISSSMRAPGHLSTRPRTIVRQMDRSSEGDSEVTSTAANRATEFAELYLHAGPRVCRVGAGFGGGCSGFTRGEVGEKGAGGGRACSSGGHGAGGEDSEGSSHESSENVFLMNGSSREGQQLLLRCVPNALT